jgi:hypothetical protein
MVALLESELRSSREARVLDIRTPTKRLAWRLCLAGLGLMDLRSVLPQIVGLSIDAAGYQHEHIHESNLEEIESRKGR